MKQIFLPPRDSSDGDDENLPNPSTLQDGWKELTTESCLDVMEDDILNILYIFKRPHFRQI